MRFLEKWAYTTCEQPRKMCEKAKKKNQHQQRMGHDLSFVKQFFRILCFITDLSTVQFFDKMSKEFFVWH